MATLLDADIVRILRDEDCGLLGSSPAIQAVVRVLYRAARVRAPLLITGESGSGKEQAAKAVHQLSDRRDAPFIAVNCAALPATLVQSELFGHDKGAFTGASGSKMGRIEAASGGTLLLDEIGDLPLEMQIHLLRFLETRTIERLGGHQSRPVDVRVIAATQLLPPMSTSN